VKPELLKPLSEGRPCDPPSGEEGGGEYEGGRGWWTQAKPLAEADLGPFVSKYVCR